MRTRHPDIAYWREVRRLIRGLRALWLAFVFTVLAVGAMVGMSFWLMPILISRDGMLVSPAMLEPDEVGAVATAAVVLLMAGVSLRAVYGHQRFWVVWVLLMVLSAFFMTADFWPRGWGWAIEAVFRGHVYYTRPRGDDYAARLLMLALATPVTSVGMAMGSVATRMIERGSGRKVGRLRRRIRRRRGLNE